MCTYATVTTTIDGSAKGPAGTWFHVTDGTVYFDHPVHAMAEHTLNIDFANPAQGTAARVAVERPPTRRESSWRRSSLRLTRLRPSSSPDLRPPVA